MLPNYQDDSVRCQCKHGFTGKPCGRYMSLCLSMEKPQLSYKEAILNRFFFFLAIEPIRCSQLFQNGFNCSGVYAINPGGGKPIQGSLWHDHRRWRLGGSVDLYLKWESYKNGFGTLSGEFWFENDNLHRLTAADDVMLRVDLVDFEGNITYAEYKDFNVTDEADKYWLFVEGYKGTAGDSMTVHR